MADLHGTLQNDNLQGTIEGDMILGYGGDDRLTGNAGNDTLHGGMGNDTLRGGIGDDFLYGEAGDDCLEGGPGNDRLFGGQGNDTYHYQPGDGFDRIDDRAGDDKLCLHGIFKQQIRLKAMANGNIIVIFQEEPIVEMRGVEWIETEEGCYSVEEWLQVQS